LPSCIAIRVLAHAVEHLPVIGEDLDLVGIALLVAQHPFHRGVAFFVHIHDGNQVFIQCGSEMVHPTSAAPDLDTPHLVPGIGGGQDVERRGGENTGRESGTS
jgi:hypothetical protein